MKKMYAITGATGNIGRRVTEALLAEGKDVRVIGRSAERLQPLVKKGAEAFVGSVDDAAAMTKAFSGVTAVFVLSPPNLNEKDYRAFQNKVGEAMTTAIRNAGVQYVVNLSSLGAEHSDKVGLVNGHYDNEQRFNGLKGVNVLHLRPAYFMENQFFGLEAIKQMNAVGGTLRGDLAVPMIATSDVATVAAKILLRLDFSGKSTRDILGHKDITMQEVAKVIGKAIGKGELNYVQFSYEDAEKAMVASGLSAGSARLMNEMHRAINEGIYQPTEVRSPENTTPTSIEEFAQQVFAPAFNQ